MAARYHYHLVSTGPGGEPLPKASLLGGYPSVEEAIRAMHSYAKEKARHAMVVRDYDQLTVAACCSVASNSCDINDDEGE